MNKSLSYYKISLFVFIIIYPWILIWNGFDLGDMGIWASAYALFFENSTHIYQGIYTCYLTILIGATWNEIFENIGIINLKIAYILITYLSLFLIYTIIKTIYPNKSVLIPLAVSLIYVLTGFSKWIDYDNLTALVYLVAITMFVKYTKNNSSTYIFIFGALLGINFFIRLSNITGLLLVLPLLLYIWGNNKTIYSLLKNLGIISLGVIFGIITVFLLMNIMGHTELYSNKISLFLHASSSPEHAYNTLSLLYMYFIQYIRLFALSLYYAAPFLVLALWYKYIYKVKEKNFYSINFIGFSIAILLLGGHLAVSHYINGTSFDLQKLQPIRIEGILYITALIFLYLERNSIINRSIILFSILLLFILPLGSVAGLYKHIYGAGLIVALLMVYILNHLEGLNTAKKYLQWTIYSFLSMLVSASLIYTITLSFELEPLLRFNMNSKLKNKRIKNLYTDYKRAEALDSLASFAQKNIPKNSYLLMDGMTKQDGIYYLTNTIPYAQPYTSNILPYVKTSKQPYILIYKLIPHNNSIDKKIADENYNLIMENTLYKLFKSSSF